MEELKKQEAVNKKRIALPKLPGGKKGLMIKIGIGMAVVVIALIWLFTASANQANNRGSSGYYQVVQAERRNLIVSVSGTATLQPADSYNVTTLVSAEIAEAPFEEGDLVEQGALLYALDKSSVERANISVKQAQLSYDTAKRAINPTATISGTINELYVHDGASVTAGTPLARIVSSLDLSIDFFFPYTSSKEFYIGQTASVFIGNFDAPVSGTVTAVSNSTSVTSNGISGCNVRVELQNPGIVSDEFTASALIGNFSSYGNAAINMSGSSVVYATTAGTVTGLTLVAGSTVREGDVLCTIDSEAARTQMENAALALESAQLMANTTLDDYNITSRISGTVIEKNYKAGEKVSAATSGVLAIIYDMSYLKMDVAVDELDIGKVEEGQTVEITADALPGQVFTGVVDKIAVRGNTVGGATSYPVTVVLEDYGNLRPGMNASAKIIGERVENAICIPVGAVKRGNTVEIPGEGALSKDGTTVANPGKIREKEISVGRNDEEYIEVLDGLKEGETILVFNKITTMMDLMMGG